MIFFKRMKTSKKDIDRFFEPKKLAIAGVSRNKKKFGNNVFMELRNKGYDVIPINPTAKEIDGVKCYSNVNELPPDIKSLLILTPKDQTDMVLREALNKGITNIWVQQMSETDETIKLAEEYQVDIINKKCIFMFAEPVVGVHKFHRAIVKFFGRLPK
jgi:predicted CoA-binding protein